MHEGKKGERQDVQDSELMLNSKRLERNYHGQSIEAIPADTDLNRLHDCNHHTCAWTLYTDCRTGNPILFIPRELSVVTKGKYTIAVSGTHGKTTTTANDRRSSSRCKVWSDGIVGSLLIGDKTNSKAISSQAIAKYFVVEACEYRRSFPISIQIFSYYQYWCWPLDYYKDIEDSKRIPRTRYESAKERVLSFCKQMMKYRDVVKDMMQSNRLSEFFNSELKLKSSWHAQ